MSAQVLHGFTAKEALDATHEPCCVSALYLRMKQERERIVNAAKSDNATLCDRGILVPKTNAASHLTETSTLTPPHPPQRGREKEPIILNAAN